MKKKIIIIILLIATFKTEAQTSVLKVADSLLSIGNYQSALVKLKSIKSPSLKVLTKTAGIYQGVGDYTNAIVFYKQAYNLSPSDKIKEKIGRSYQASGNSSKAIELYEEVLKAKPENRLLKYELAKLYSNHLKVNKAIDLFSELSKKDTLNPNYQYQLGVAYHKLGQKGFYDSGNHFLKTYKIDSLHLKSIYNLVKFYKKLKFKDSTSLFIDKGLKINPKSVSFNQLKVKDVFLKKEFDTTLVYLKTLEELNSKTMFTYKMYGLTYLKLKNYEKAKSYFRIAQTIDFKDVNVLYNLGLVNKALKNYKEAEMNFLMSINFQRPDVDANYYELGTLQLEQKQLKKALESFTKGYENNRKNYLILFQLAMLTDDYYKDKKIALKHYKKYISSFSTRHAASTLYAKQRIKEIKKELFIKGERVD